jgi:glutathione S-transferase
MRKLYYTHNINPRVAVATARYLEAPVEYLRIAPKGADEAMIRPFNPNTLAPVLVEDDGTSLWETDAITWRLARLTGSDFWQTDRLDEMLQWVSWSAHHFTRAGGTYTFENVTMVDVPGWRRNLMALEEAEADFHQLGGILDEVLAKRDWLVGGKLSYADFRVATALPFAEAASIPLAGYGNIQRWHDRLLEIDAWREPFAGIA